MLPCPLNPRGSFQSISLVWFFAHWCEFTEMMLQFVGLATKCIKQLDEQLLSYCMSVRKATVVSQSPTWWLDQPETPEDNVLVFIQLMFYAWGFPGKISMGRVEQTIEEKILKLSQWPYLCQCIRIYLNFYSLSSFFECEMYFHQGEMQKLRTSKP